MNYRNLLLLSFLCALLNACQNKTYDTEWPVVTKEMKPWTRWWWMGSAVNEANLSYHLHEMAKAGIGGVEVTPIYGVKGEEANYIPYLTPQWMRMFYFAKSETKRLGMGIDMNMGTGWPFGGPSVSLEDAATKAIFQEYEVSGGSPFSEKIAIQDEKQTGIARLERLMAYAPGGKAEDITSLVDSLGNVNWSAPKGKKYRLVAQFTGKTLQQVKRAAPGGQGYVLNPFDRNAVERYFATFDKAFSGISNSYPHSFFNDSFEVYGADWTPGFLEAFEQRRGYKLEEHFPDLLAKGETKTSARIISDYRETLGELLKENFTIPWTTWAHRHNVTIRNQAHGSPANLIDLYAAVDIPECETFGITDFDIPGLRKDSIRKENDGDPTTLKYASSAAHLSGKKYTSAETFTWLTEHFRTSLSQCKPEIDQMFISGVNHVYFHGSTYSPRDAAWPGWKFYASVDMSPTNPLWRDAPSFFNYITRVQSFLQEGEPDNDFLLYLPIYDFWAEQKGNHYLAFSIHDMRHRLPEFCRTVLRIQKNGYDVDYISDRFIQTASVEDGLLRTEGGTTYRALILPSVKRLPPETLDKIRRLTEEGATVVFADRYPSDVPGYANLTERQDTLKTLLKNFPQPKRFSQATSHPMGEGRVITGNNYTDLLSLCDIEKEVFHSDFGGGYIRRKHTDGHHYFFTMLQNRTIDGWIPLAVKARSALFFDPMTGKTGKAKVRTSEGRSEVYMQLKPGQSLILKTFTDKQAVAEDWRYYSPSGAKKELTDGWKMSFVRSRPEVREEFSLPALGSWTDLPGEDLQRNMGTARYSTTFHLEKTEAEYLLSLGDVRESARVFINGQPVDTLYAVPFEAKIGSYLVPGENTLVVEVTNLPANRIADYDRRDVEWRVFHEINFVSITYEDTRFDGWGVIPSGLLGPVTIEELKEINP